MLAILGLVWVGMIVLFIAWATDDEWNSTASALSPAGIRASYHRRRAQYAAAPARRTRHSNVGYDPNRAAAANGSWG